MSEAEWLSDAFKRYTAVLVQQGRVQSDADANVLRYILSYLAQNPNAQDTLVGISQWWLQKQKGADAVRDLQELLDEMVRDQLILCLRRADGQICYQFNCQYLSAAAKILCAPNQRTNND